MQIEVSEPRIERVIVVGSGAAGYTAALYAARAGLEPLEIEGSVWGGSLAQTSRVENYPGYPNGVMGPDMMRDFRSQAERFGARYITDDATELALSKTGAPHRVSVGGRQLSAWTVVLAMGAVPRRLGAPGEAQLLKRGLSYCGSDVALSRAPRTAIIGGGDTAMEEAMFLSTVSQRITIVHRRPEFRASRIMVERVRALANVDFLTPFDVESFEPDDTGVLKRVVLRSTATGERIDKVVDHVVVSIGSDPQSALVKRQVELDSAGYVITHDNSTRTAIPGVFAAGALADPVYRQAVTAAGSGCQAAIDAESFLRDAELTAGDVSLGPLPSRGSPGLQTAAQPAA
jgi:thioredoxin reductase (NADPH)